MNAEDKVRLHTLLGKKKTNLFHRIGLIESLQVELIGVDEGEVTVIQFNEKLKRYEDQYGELIPYEALPESWKKFTTKDAQTKLVER
jgi:hypothetical protein